MLCFPYVESSTFEGEAAQPLLLKSSPMLGRSRDPLRHILVGSQASVQQAIHTLHVLNYVEQAQWSRLIQVPSGGIVITPSQGAVMRYLLRDRLHD